MVLTQVTTSPSSSYSSALAITVTRKRVENRRNKALKANVAGKDITTGWLDLVTLSSESATSKRAPAVKRSATTCA